MKVPEPRKLPSGSWFIQLRLNGESIPVTADTKKECLDQARLIKAEYLAGKREIKHSDGKTLKQACQEYIDRRRNIKLDTTLAGYEKITRNYFQEIIDLPLTKITWEVMSKEISRECSRTSARGQKLSAKTIINAFGFYSSVLAENGIEFNRDFALPELKRKPIQLPSAEEVYGAVKGTAIELPCLLAMWLTMSISEIRGLTKSKSIYNGQISIVETVVDVDGKAIRKEGGKEELRSRTQTIPPYIQGLIDAVDGDVICPLSSQATNKRLQRLLEKAGVRPVSFHKLRHISASTMALLNIPSNYAQEKGGWKTDHVMKGVYTHTFTAGRQDADRKMDSLFSEIITGEKKETIEITISADAYNALMEMANKEKMTLGEAVESLINNQNANEFANVG